MMIYACHIVTMVMDVYYMPFSASRAKSVGLAVSGEGKRELERGLGVDQ